MKKYAGNFIASSLDAVGKILHRSSAVGPILAVILSLVVLCGVGLFFSFKNPSLIPLEYGIFGLLVISVLAFVGVFIYFSIKNPRALQSEHLQITMRQLDLAVASKGHVSALVTDEDETNVVEEGSNSGQQEMETTRSFANTVKEA